MYYNVLYTVDVWCVQMPHHWLRLSRVDLFLLVSLPPGVGALMAFEVTCRLGVQAGTQMDTGAVDLSRGLRIRSHRFSG